MSTKHCLHDAVEPGAKHIPLTRGYCAIVDENDYGWLNQYTWFFHDRYAQRNLISTPYTSSLMRRMQNWILPPVEGMTVDHVKHNHKLDNRRSNLRYATWQQQMSNRGPFKGRRFKGVYLAKQCRQNPLLPQRWESQIRVHAKLIQIGTFATQEEAALAYNRAAQNHFGEFACLNQLAL